MESVIEIQVGDQLVFWWPNGHGYDVYTVGQDLERAKITKIAEYEIAADGIPVRVQKI